MAIPTIEQLLAAGQAAEAVRQMEQALSGDLAPADRFDLEMLLADTLAYHLGQSMDGLTHYGEALRVAQQHELPAIYRAEMGVGQALHEQGRPDQALLYLEMASKAAEGAGDILAAAAAMAMQGNILMELGEYEEAARLMERVEKAGKAQSNLHLQAQSLASQALLQAYLERYERAEELGRSAVAVAKESGDVGLVAVAYLRMGQIMYQQDRFGPAYYWFKAGGDVAREAGIEQLIAVFDEAAEATGIQPEIHDDDHEHAHEHDPDETEEKKS